MASNETLHVFNAEVEKIGSIHGYISRYSYTHALQLKWSNRDMIKALVNSDLGKQKTETLQQLLSISYGLIASRKIEAIELCDMIPGDRYGRYFGACLMLFNNCWEMRNEPKRLGQRMIELLLFSGPHAIPYKTLAGAGDQFLPYITDSLYYLRSSMFYTSCLTIILVEYIGAMITDYRTASPEATHLRAMYTKFSKATGCRRAVVKCLSKYPEECKAVVKAMHQIARYDADHDIRKQASDFINARK